MLIPEIAELCEEQYQAGVAAGIALMMEKIKRSCDDGTPIFNPIDNRVYFIKSDIQNLQDIMDNLEG